MLHGFASLRLPGLIKCGGVSVSTFQMPALVARPILACYSVSSPLLATEIIYKIEVSCLPLLSTMVGNVRVASIVIQAKSSFLYQKVSNGQIYSRVPKKTKELLIMKSNALHNCEKKKPFRYSTEKR